MHTFPTLVYRGARACRGLGVVSPTRIWVCPGPPVTARQLQHQRRGTQAWSSLPPFGLSCVGTTKSRERGTRNSGTPGSRRDCARELNCGPSDPAPQRPRLHRRALRSASSAVPNLHLALPYAALNTCLWDLITAQSTGWCYLCAHMCPTWARRVAFRRRYHFAGKTDMA